MSYWDSSALVKLYASEPDSATFEQFAASARTVPVTSRLALCEIETTLCRKETEGMLAAGTALTIHQRLIRDGADGHIRVVEFSTEVRNCFHDVLARCFRQAPPLHVRTLDAIHLGSALAAGESEFVATDKRLRDAALRLGLRLFP
jgi:predicted nucleic acid-binding protein